MNMGLPSTGEFFSPDGTRLEGSWHDDRGKGEGKIWFFNGDIYKGLWKLNLPEGTGKMFEVTGGIYDGSGDKD